MDNERSKLAIKAIQEKKATQPCSRCGHSSFSVAGESFLSLQDDPNVLNLGGPRIPVVLIGCDNCGHIIQHASKALGLL